MREGATRAVALPRAVFHLFILLATACSSLPADRDASGAQDGTLLPLVLPDPQSATVTAQSRFEKNGFKLIAEHVWYELKPARYLAIFERSEGDFHAAGAEVGGLFAEYADSSNTWTVMSDSLSFTQLGSWGHAPKPSFIRLGPNAVGIMFEGGFTGQGYLSQDLRLFGIVNGKFVEVLGVPTLTGSMESTDVQAEIFQVVDSSQEIYPLRAKISYGKDPDPDFVKVFGPGPTAEFRFRNGRFERQ